MTHIAVFSDTHGDLSRLSAAVSRSGPVDAFLHLGDLCSDAQRIASRLKCPFHVVRGNNDFSGHYPNELIVHYEKTSLLMTHGHLQPDVQQLAYMAEEQHCDAVLFGHSHAPLLQSMGCILIINPGSLSRPRFGAKASFSLLHIEEREIRVQMITL